MLSVNEKAPTFRAESTKGPVDLSEFLGKKSVVLIFYPIDETPTCTAQLCAVRDAAADYAAADAVVFGVNPADRAAHDKFAQKQGYDFPLVVDEGGRIRKAYGVGKMFGLFAQQRIVYAIGKDGRIVYAQKGNPPTAEILAALRGA